MKQFLKLFFFFCATIILIIYPLDRLFSLSLAKTGAGEFSVWNDILNGKVNSQILIYGSSRAWVQVNPEILEDSIGLSAYNFGIDGHNFRLQYLRHILNISNSEKPKMILQIVDHATLQKRTDLYNLNQFLPYMLYNKLFYEYTGDYKGFTKTDYFVPLLRYSGNTNALANILLAWFNKTENSSVRNKGFKANDKQWTKDFIKAKKNMKSYDIIVDSASLDLYKGFLRECQSNSIQVIMIYPPEYIEGQVFIGGRENLIALYQEISDEFNVPFIDYSDDALSYQKDLFYNVLHLNKKGSELFSSDLAFRIKKHVR